MPLPFLKKLSSRLVLRIHVIGLLQFAFVLAGFGAFGRQSAESFHTFIADQDRFVLEGLAASGTDRAALAEEVARVERGCHWSLAVFDEAGGLLAKAGAVEIPAPSEVRGPRRSWSPPDIPGLTEHFRAAKISLASGQAATVVYRVRVPRPPGLRVIVGLVLIVVTIASWLTARALARPLSRLTTVARAFGKGQLDARAAMARADELGEVGRAFDEMAERISKLLRAEKELLANVSHELRTPLARIRVALDLASEGNAEMARESLGEIAADLAELERIVDDVLIAARLSLREGTSGASSGPQVRAEPVDVAALLQKSIARFRAAHPGRPLHAEVSEQLPLITADPVLLRRVVDNLLENAHKYTEEPERPIDLEATSPGDSVSIVVRDRGMGIAKADLERVFEPFFRADRSRTRATGGLGLGLALSRRIVAAHGGTLRLESEVARGTSAHLEVPALAEEAAPAVG